MTIYTLSHGSLKLDVSDQGASGAIRRRSYVLVKKAVWQPMPHVFRWCHLQTGWAAIVLSGRGVSINCNRMLSGMRTIYTAMAGWASGNVSRTAMIVCVWCMNIAAVSITIG